MGLSLPEMAKEGLMRKLSTNENPEAVLKTITPQDIDAFSPEKDMPSVNVFSRSAVYETTGKLLRFLDADVTKKSEHARTYAALKDLKSRMDAQAVYSTPVIGDALQRPKLLASILGGLGILTVAQRIVDGNEKPKRSFFVKALAAVGIVGLAAFLLKHVNGGQGLGLGLGKDSPQERKVVDSSAAKPKDAKTEMLPEKADHSHGVEVVTEGAKNYFFAIKKNGTVTALIPTNLDEIVAAAVARKKEAPNAVSVFISRHGSTLSSTETALDTALSKAGIQKNTDVYWRDELFNFDPKLIRKN